jgi:hypothetical protein
MAEMSNPLFHPATVGRLCSAIASGPMTPAVRQLVEIAGILSTEHAKAQDKIAKLEAPPPKSTGDDWEVRTEKPRVTRDIVAEYTAGMEQRTTKPADVIARRIASAAGVQPKEPAQAPTEPARALEAPELGHATREPAPPAVDAMKAHQDQQKEQARIRQQRKRARDRQRPAVNRDGQEATGTR